MDIVNVIDAETLHEWQTRKNIHIIDVREPFEYEAGHIAGSINMPLSSLETNLDKIKQLPYKNIILQCKAGVRSMTACFMIAESGTDKILWNLNGGIGKWNDLGYEIVARSKAHI